MKLLHKFRFCQFQSSHNLIRVSMKGPATWPLISPFEAWWGRGIELRTVCCMTYIKSSAYFFLALYLGLFFKFKMSAVSKLRWLCQGKSLRGKLNLRQCSLRSFRVICWKRSTAFQKPRPKVSSCGYGVREVHASCLFRVQYGSTRTGRLPAEEVAYVLSPWMRYVGCYRLWDTRWGQKSG